MSGETLTQARKQPLADAKQLRVLHIGKYYPPYRGGIETHLQTLCEGLRGQVDLTVLVANDGLGTKRETVGGITVERAGMRFQLAGAPVCPGMVESIRAAEADIVHLHLPNPAAVLAYFASGHRGKVVVSYHSDVVRQKVLRWVFAPFLHRLLQRSAAVIAATQYHAESSTVLARYRDRCHVIPYGIPLGRYEGTEAAEVERIRAEYGPRLVIGVGRLVYYKGFEHLIEAMAGIDGTLLLIGEGPLRRSLEQKARNLGGADRVVFLGQVPDPTPYYSAADVFVLPSVARSEAFGIVQLEAMACGTPVINTQLASGVPYVSRHGETGLTVPPADSRRLAAAIEMLLDDADLNRRLGEEARRRVQQEFSQETMVQRTLELYRAVAASRPVRIGWT